MEGTPRHGLTLIEVVVALALAGSLLTVTVVASSQHLRQMKSAAQKSEATRRLDMFLAAWSVSGFQRGAIGESASQAELSVPIALVSDNIARKNEDHGNRTESRYRLEFQRNGRVGLGTGMRLQMTVFASPDADETNRAAWAEIIVNEDF